MIDDKDLFLNCSGDMTFTMAISNAAFLARNIIQGQALKTAVENLFQQIFFLGRESSFIVMNNLEPASSIFSYF